MVNTELGLRLKDKSHVDPAASHLGYWCLRSENELLSFVQRGVYHPAGAAGVASPQIIRLPRFHLSTMSAMLLLSGTPFSF